MPSVLTERPRDAAERVARCFASLPEIQGVCLFGSVARGDPSGWSDIDLLLVGTDRDLSPRLLLRRLPAECRVQPLSLVYLQPDEARQLFATGSTFVQHLRREGQILHEGGSGGEELPGLVRLEVHQDRKSVV